MKDGKKQDKVKNGKENLGVALSSLSVGDRCRITRLCFDGGEWQRLVDLGFRLGAVVGCVGESPVGDPRAYTAAGAVVAIRNTDARRICVERLSTEYKGG